MIASSSDIRRKLYPQAILLVILVLLAITRWLSGGDVLAPERGMRGWFELGFLVVAFSGACLLWGIKPLLAGWQSPSFVIMLVFCLWALVSALWAPNYLLSMGKAFSMGLITLVMMAVVYQCVWQGVEISTIFYFGLLAIILFYLIINFVYFDTPLPLDWEPNRPRLFFAYNHPNETAALLCPFFLCGLDLLVRKKVKFYRLGVVISLLVCLGLLYLTDSRSSMIALGVGTIFYLLLGLPARATRLTLGLAFILLGLIFFLLFMGGLFDDVLSSLSQEEFDSSTITGRISLWISLVEGLPAVNVVGNGYFSPRFYNLSLRNWGTSAHNSFLEVYATTGMVGFMLLFFFLVSGNTIYLNGHQYRLGFSFVVYAMMVSFFETRLFVPSSIMVMLLALFFEAQICAIRDRGSA